jgi:DNA ligase-4
VALFSRNGKNYTHIYRGIAQLLPRALDCEGCILDGEVVVLELVRDSRGEVVEYRQVEFGMNKTMSLNQDEERPDFLLCYKVFDLLWVRVKGQ